MSETPDPDAHSGMTTWYEKPGQWMESFGQRIDSINFLNPFFNPYNHMYEINGQKMDYFGHQANKLASKNY